MRVILVGSARDRARVRAQLAGEGVDILAEVDTLADARAAHMRADALIVAEDLSGHSVSLDDEERMAEPLTPREIDVLELLTEGLPNKGIAERLGISDQTVKFHIGSILGKLGATNRTEAVRLALRRGLVNL
jgi:DNA-binding NarL/FixJ family response regulator